MRKFLSLLEQSDLDFSEELGQHFYVVCVIKQDTEKCPYKVFAFLGGIECMYIISILTFKPSVVQYGFEDFYCC